MGWNARAKMEREYDTVKQNRRLEEALAAELRGVNLSEAQLATSHRLKARLELVHSVADRLWNRWPVPAGTLLANLFARLVLPPLSGCIVCPTVLGFDLCISKGTGENYYRLGSTRVGRST